jgi:hypothetical protein
MMQLFPGWLVIWSAPSNALAVSSAEDSAEGES